MLDGGLMAEASSVERTEILEYAELFVDRQHMVSTPEVKTYF